MEPVRVLHAIAPSHMSGAEMYLARLIPRLLDSGHFAPVVCHPGRGVQGVLGDYLQKYGAPRPLVAPIGGKLNPVALWHLWRTVKQQQCTFTHSHLSSASHWCGLLNRAGVPSLGHVQGFTSARWHARQKLLLACSEAVRQDLINQGIEPGKIFVLPNPVDPSDFVPQREPGQVRTELGIGEDIPLIGAFAHLRSEKKGWPEFFEAVALLRQKTPKFQVLICGQGPLQPGYESLVANLGLQEHVRFLGFRRDAADIMSAVDVMALPSRREPFGIVYVEAALLGKPSIACNAGGAPEVVVPGETGWLVTPQDAQSIALAMEQAITDTSQTRAMGQTARERALDLYGWQRSVTAMEEIYARMLS